MRFINADDYEDEENLVYMDKTYHKVIHTDIYFFTLETSTVVAYVSRGRTGVRSLLFVYKFVLGGL